MLTSDFIKTPRGRESRQRQRYARQLRLKCPGVEPRPQKPRYGTEADAFQRDILRQMVALRRRAFRGPVVLELSLRTTSKNPPLAHTLAKNYLDLLGKPRPGVSTRRKGILFGDDSQVNGLSVMCEHGAPTPSISITALSLSDFLADLDLALHVSRYEQDGWERGWQREHDRKETDALDRLAEVLRDEHQWRVALGDRGYEAAVRHARSEAQRLFLMGTALSVSELAHMFGCTGDDFLPRGYPGLASVFTDAAKFAAEHPFRFVLGELPRGEDTRERYRRAATERVREFAERSRFAWVLSPPLATPVAIEVVVKPPVASPPGRQHDLDNVVRDFLLPGVLNVLKPPGSRAGRGPAHPRVTLTRYDAWRIPRFAGDDTPGFVSVAVVPDYLGTASMVTRVSGTLTGWEVSVD